MITRRTLLRAGLGVPAIVASAPLAAMGRKPAFAGYGDHDGLGLASLVGSGEVSPGELLEAAIEAAEAVNPRINALSARLYERARKSIRRGLPQGPFRGVPFLVKDLYMDIAGEITANGSRFWRDHRAEADSTLVRRYEAAGLVIFGKTTTPELGLTPTTESALTGATRNPWDPERIAGGSSGGAAAAVAAGIVPMANASDGGGSIRTPASCCGLFGMKPTRGRIPLGPGRTEGWAGCSTVHAVTRSVRDSAALMDATHGPEPGAPYVAPPPPRPYLDEVGAQPGELRVALVEQPASGTPVDPVCIEAARDAAQLCEALGHRVDEATLPVDHGELSEAFLTVIAVQTLKAVSQRAAELGREPGPEDIEPITALFAGLGRQKSGLDYARAVAAFQRASRQMARFHDDFDVILSPTLARPPEKIGVLGLSPADRDAWVEAVSSFGPYCAIYNMTGQPAMSVPVHWTVETRLPIGTMFAGRFGDESTLFRLAGQLEQIRPWWNERPPISA